MRSPFPGMDPYIERYWEGAHARLIVSMADALATQLPDDLAARIAMAEPVILNLNADPVIDRHIEIEELDGNRIVTAIELLSHTTKTGPGRAQYVKRRNEFMAGGIHLVEIDLLRTGSWFSRLQQRLNVPSANRMTYRVSVWRPNDLGNEEFHPIGLQMPLPKIAIPLRPQEPDVELELQPLMDRVYRLSRFDRIDYSKPCEPPLDEEDAAWARERIAEASAGAKCLISEQSEST